MRIAKILVTIGITRRTKMAGLLELLEYIKGIPGGLQSKSFAKKHEGLRDKAQDIAYWGDPSGKIVNYSDEGRPIYEGGYFHTANVSSELNRNLKEARNEEGPMNIPWERSAALAGAGVSPYRLGGLDDPYAGYTGGIDASYYTGGGRGLPSLSGVGVSGVRGGAVGDEIDDYLTSIIRSSNPRGDYMTHTSSQRGRGPGSDFQKYFESVYQTPKGPTKYSQLGSGPGSSQYFEHPTEGSGSWRYKGLLGMLGLPSGTYNPR